MLGRTLGRRTPAYLGKISYGTYLWHWPVILVIREFVLLPAWILALGTCIVATGLAALSYELLEMPIRRAPSLNKRQWQAVAAGLSASVLAAVFIGPVLSSDRRPVVVPRATAVQPPATDAAWATQPVPTDLDWKALANDRGPDPRCSPDKPDDCVIVRGPGAHIALVGDSQARVLMPAFEQLAKEHGLTLSASILVSCPWQAGMRNSPDPAKWERCHEARDDWYRQVLPKLHPDVVFVISLDREGEYWRKTLKPLSGDDVPLRELLRTSTEETARLVTSSGARLVILDDMLQTNLGKEPLDCLATAEVLGDCAVAVPEEQSLTYSVVHSTVAATPGVTTFDLNPIMCPDAPVCAPMLDGITVWRDSHHFNTQIVLHFRDQLWQAIRRLGVLK
jgi:SGNH domain-containing protein